MKHHKVKAIALLSLIATTAASAYANSQNEPLNPVLLTQRCVAADVTIDKNDTGKFVSTDCLWKLTRKDTDGNDMIEDPDMQITMHIANDVDTVGVHCTFVPSNLNSQTMDRVVDVAVSKGAKKDNGSRPSQLPPGSWLSFVTDSGTGQTDIMAIVTNYKNNPDGDMLHHQANVIFDLNRERNTRWYHPFSTITFHENDTLQCTFSPGIIPALASTQTS